MPGGGSAATGPTFAELSEKLSKLREHLDQVVDVLNAPLGDGVVGEQPDGVALRGFRNSAGTDRRLHCHECGRIGSKDEATWTLRLCGDDELHAFCLDCDKYFSNNGA
jgi:hypothetical protein